MPTLILSLFACAPPTYVGPVDEVAAPNIDILFPNPIYMSAEDQTRPICPTFQLVVSVENMVMLGPVTENAEGEGHWHFYPNASDDSVYFPVYSNVLDMTEPMAEGSGAIKANLTQNDHSPLPEELQGEDEAIAELTIADTEDCIGSRQDLSGGDTGDAGTDDSGE